ncbi:GPN-loop GTPase 2-like [Eriocheir sinensis]|uniref:GPN-loop GTPase 2-like n=1 Tax=Eriocheir sinensis TaxID=95602 RepID=UPI0021C81E12|nr:GPN-loop GTPase 2-like [Eriocheir sinensis]
MGTQFGQVVLGPPGSGKTTYCKAMARLLQNLGRKVAVINLDPANDTVPYDAAVDIQELVQVEEVMAMQGVGPNGALVFCMELLEANITWLINKLKKLHKHYLIFDLPGQAELYSHHTMVRSILSALEKEGARLCAVNLVDSHYANDPGKYVSAVMLTLSSMLMMEMPTVNILSKVDAVEKYGALDMGLDFYTEVMDLDYLLEYLGDAPGTRKYQKLNKAMAEVVTDYSLVSYIPVSVESHSTLLNAMKAIDKANGYIYGSGEERNIQRLLSCAVGAEWEHDRLGVPRDTFMKEEDDEEDDGENEDNVEEVLAMLARQNQDKA